MDARTTRKSSETGNVKTRKPAPGKRDLIEIASDIEATSCVYLEDVDDQKWDVSFAESLDVLDELATEARRDYRIRALTSRRGRDNQLIRSKAALIT